jgi:threonine aldolase
VIDVDLRSDTVTLPSPEMRRAIAEAELGDDVFGDDPTVNRLQEVAAERFGKETGLFVSSGTMGNLLGNLVNARSGQEIIVDAISHVFMNEAGGTATLGGIQVRPIATEAGIMRPEQVQAAIRPRDDTHQPLTAAVCIENTHNGHGGVAWPLADIEAVAAVARANEVRLHIDGARIFNASLASGVDVRDMAALADTVTFCLSKGLGCPIGSVLLGTEEDIHQARRWRKMLGGGTRQAGVLAAAGLYALDNMVERLADDHANARTLAEGLAEIDGINLDLSRVQTNLVIFRLTSMPAKEFLAACSERGVRGGGSGDRVRFVTHFGIEPEHIQRALEVSADVLAGREATTPAHR